MAHVEGSPLNTHCKRSIPSHIDGKRQKDTYETGTRICRRGKQDFTNSDGGHPFKLFYFSIVRIRLDVLMLSLASHLSLQFYVKYFIQEDHRPLRAVNMIAL